MHNEESIHFTLVLLLIGATALAETKEFEIYVLVYEVLESNHITFPTSGASAVKKNDGDQYFYLTPTYTNLPSGRNIYFRSMYSHSTSESAIASKYIKMTKTSHDPKAKYYSGKAVGGHTYYLAAAGQAIPNDEFLGNTSFIVQGRWTP